MGENNIGGRSLGSGGPDDSRSFPTPSGPDPDHMYGADLLDFIRHSVIPALARRPPSTFGAF